MSDQRISDEFSDDLREIALELLNRDDRAALRRVHYLVNELPEEQRLRGLFRVGSKICMMRSILRADLERRARGEPLPGATIDNRGEPLPGAAIDSLPSVQERESGLDASAEDGGDALPVAAGAASPALHTKSAP